MNLPIYFAPLQGYTEDVYRRLHHELFGGITAYYTPFLRVEAGSVRSKDLRDIDPQHNEGVPIVPQIIMKSKKEFDYLVDVVAEKGYREIDLNMGCPFPMQAKHGRGSGLLANLPVIEEILSSMQEYKEISFSVKMRLGWEDQSECMPVQEMLNAIPLKQITLHPRIGKQQYKGEVDDEAFRLFYENCKHPLVYNGDLCSMKDVEDKIKEFPRLAGVMLGRGLLARPSLAKECLEGREWSWRERKDLILEMHARMRSHYESVMNNESQVHSKLCTFWEYMEPELDRKVYKKIMKSGNLKNYLLAVNEVERMM